MSTEGNTERRNTSGIQVDSGTKGYAVTGTVTLSRRDMGIPKRREKPPEKSAAPPAEEIAKMPVSIATESEVGCPRCREKFDISPDFHNTVTECPSCSRVFIIRPPGTAPEGASPANAAGASAPPPRPGGGPPPPPAQKKATTSGIEVGAGGIPKEGITGTVLLSREGMGMMQRKRGARRPASAAQRGAAPSRGAAPAPQAAQQEQELPPPPAPELVADMIYSVATENDVGCPQCCERFEISPEFYGAVAECPECSTEFVIKPPGTPEYVPPAAAPAPAPVAPAAAPSTRPSPTSPPKPPAAPAEESKTAPVEDKEAVAPAGDSVAKKNNPLVIGLLVFAVILLIALIVIVALK